MAKFSATDAAMTGFGVIRRRPVLLVWWTLFHILFIGGLSVLSVAMAGPAMMRLSSFQGMSTQDPAVQSQALATLMQVAPLWLVSFPILAIFYAVLYAAMNRAVLRPAESAFGYLRLGADELRQIGLFLLALVVAIGAYLFVLAGGIAFGVAAGIGLHVSDGGQGATIFRWSIFAFVFLIFLAWIFVCVRLSLASALTFDRRKVNLFGSWRLTRGRFWPMFGTYVLAWLFAAIVGILGGVVLFACAAIAGGGFGFMAHPDMSSLAVYLTPVRIVYLVLSGLLYALVWPVLMTPSAAIYAAVTTKPEPRPSSWLSEPNPPAPAPAPSVGSPSPPSQPAPGASFVSPLAPSPPAPKAPLSQEPGDPFCETPDAP